MNKDKRLLLICVVVMLGLLGCNIYLNYENNKLVKEQDNAEEETTNNTANEGNNITKEVYYDCSFTKTYRVVDLLDGYVAEVPEMSYVVVDQYLTHGAYAHIITSELKKKLEVNKYYEFTYTLKGATKDKINDIDDVDEELISKFENAINFLLKLKPEFTVLGLKDLVSLNKKLVKGLFIEELDNDDIIDFITENDYIFE